MLKLFVSGFYFYFTCASCLAGGSLNILRVNLTKWMDEMNEKKIYIARLKTCKCMFNLPRLADN